MTVAIDEITTHIAPPTRDANGNPSRPAPTPAPSPEAERRKWREHAERHANRAARLAAD